MKVLLINPPFLYQFSRSQRSPAITKGGTLYYPYWLVFAGAVLEKNGIDFDLLDCPAEDIKSEDVLERIYKEKYNLIIIDTSTASIEKDVKFANKAKEKNPEAVIAMVGTHVTAVADDVLKKTLSVDIAIRREYDYTVTDIAKNLNDYSGVEGISYRDENGKIKHNKDRELIKDLNEIPFISPIYKKYLNIRNYYFAAADYPMVMLISGRGCPNGCTFCVYPQTMFSRQYRFRSPKNVVRELKYIAEEMPEVKDVVFEDDTITADIDRIREMCNLIIKEKINIKWTCNSRVSNGSVVVDIETLRLMKKAGCRLIVPGFESGNQKILDAMHKNITLEQSLEFMENAKKVDILVHGCFVFGFPGETKETMRETLEFAKRLNPDSAQFYPAFVYPGTELYQWASKKGYITTKDYSQWIKKDGQHNCVLSLPDGLTPEYLTEFSEKAYREFHFRLRYLGKKIVQLFTSPAEGWRSIKSAKNYFTSCSK